MAFTREFVRRIMKESGVELPKEAEDALMNEHISARDAFAEGKVKTALEENKQEPAPNVKDTKEYKDLKKEFEDYKLEQGKKESRAAKEAAYRELLKEAGVSEKRINTVLKVSDVDSVELVDGKIKDASELTKTIKSEWTDFIVTEGKRGADTKTPPNNAGGGKDAFNAMTLTQKMQFANEHPAEYAAYTSEKG
jgi:predicted XRE-type DNA-binding protein